MTDISITIVAYHNEEDVRNAVDSILENTAASISKRSEERRVGKEC